MITRDNLAAALKDLGYAHLGTDKSWSKAWPEMEAEIVGSVEWYRGTGDDEEDG